MDTGEKLKLLCDQAKTWYSTLTDFIFKHSTFQIIIIGWAITSTSARAYVQNLSGGFYFMPGVLLFAYSVLVFLVYRIVARKSHQVLAEIATLDKEAWHIVSRFRLKRSFWMTMAAVHLALSATAAFCLYCFS